MPGQDPAPRPRKPRRFTAEPQQVSKTSLVGVFELPHGSGRPDPKAGQLDPETGQLPAAGDKADATTGDGGNTGAPAGDGTPKAAASDPVLEQGAGEDDPRAWGDGEEDLGEWMRSQRPPHWD